MKKITFTVLAIMLVLLANATEISTTSKITDVTVYLKGATIYSNSQAQIPIGVSEIRITNLSRYIDANSIQVAGSGKYTILGVSYEINYIEKIEQTQKVNLLIAERKQLQEDIEFITAQTNVYSTELNLLEKNMSLKGNETGLLVSELEKAANFYRTRLLELQKKQIELSREKIKKQTKITEITNQLNSLQASTSKPTGEIVVSVSSKKLQTVSLDLSYYIAQAGWAPVYDIRVQDVNANVDLTYKANVYQNTGFEWGNVALTLSTGNPSLGGNVPTINKWILRKQYTPDYSRKAQVNKKMKKSYSQPMAVMADEEMEDVSIEELSFSVEKEKATYNWAVVEQKTTSIEFVIDEKVTVNSGGSKALVTVQQYSMPAYYIYKCVPKLDKDAFLIAKIGGYEKYNLLEGPANLFFQGAYVGESYINPNQVTDSLQLSLGRDKGVVVERKSIEEYSSKKVIAQKRKENQGFEISIKNNKSIPINIIVLDQIPISGQEEITVSDKVYDRGVLNEDTGIVTWDLTISNGNSEKVQIKYLITYPKTWRINK